MEIPEGNGGAVFLLTAAACGVYVLLNLHAAVL
jgi:hypothetical protein